VCAAWIDASTTAYPLADMHQGQHSRAF